MSYITEIYDICTRIYMTYGLVYIAYTKHEQSTKQM